MSLSSQKSELQRVFPTGLFIESLYIIVSDGKMMVTSNDVSQEKPGNGRITLQKTFQKTSAEKARVNWEIWLRL